MPRGRASIEKDYYSILKLRIENHKLIAQLRTIFIYFYFINERITSFYFSIIETENLNRKPCLDRIIRSNFNISRFNSAWGIATKNKKKNNFPDRVRFSRNVTRIFPSRCKISNDDVPSSSSMIP